MLCERGHQVTVLTLSDTLEHQDAHPFRLIRLKRRAPLFLRWPKTIATILRDGRKADLLFVNGLQFESAVANLLLRKPLVLKVVGDLAWERATNKRWTSDSFEEFQLRRHSLRTTLMKRLRQWWTRAATRVIVPSRYLAAAVNGWGVPAHIIRVIYNAVAEPACAAAVPVPLKTAFRAAAVGRLIPIKRVDQILTAVARIPSLGLVVVGDGSEKARLRALAASLHLADRVFFAGRCAHDEVFALLHSCDFYVQNSLHEGLPHGVMEAFAAGIPVVATAAGGTAEIVANGQNGLLVPVENSAEKLTAALQRLVDSADLREQLARGARAAAREFSRLRMLDETERFLMETASATGPE
jgi:glycosyltransferase involved in cell wall biosynthesis